MVARAIAKYIRISPTKVRPVIALVKNKKVAGAISELTVINKRGAYYLNKVLKSALANAKNKGYQEDKLFISKIVANPGPTLKRHRAASFGRATMIRKRTSHILIELGSSEKLIKGTKTGKGAKKR
ncbi:MAG: 50S ribosomal protein L22 [Candidatus Omnitrophota bacterium]